MSRRNESGPSPRALISASTLDVRAEPSLGSAVIGTLPRAWPVAILDDDGPRLTIDGVDDHWSHIATFRCIDAACAHHETGWVANSYLALDDRFELLDDGRSGTLSGYDSQSVFTYDVSANGAFTRWRLPCTAGACDAVRSVTPNCDHAGELPLGSVCVLTGTLHRHGTLVRGKSPNGDWLDRQDVNLIINAFGELCVQDPVMIDGACPCAASGHAAHAGHDPVLAIARLAAERRQRLALTATVSLNLRAAPSLSGGIVARLPRASTVERIGEQRIPVILNGRSDRWVQVSVVDCSDNTGCAPEAVGWVMDSYLAYEHRLTPVTDWPRAERSGNQALRLRSLVRRHISPLGGLRHRRFRIEDLQPDGTAVPIPRSLCAQGRWRRGQFGLCGRNRKPLPHFLRHSLRSCRPLRQLIGIHLADAAPVSSHAAGGLLRYSAASLRDSLPCSSSISRTAAMVFRTLSGVRLIESMPCRTRNWATSG